MNSRHSYPVFSCKFSLGHYPRNILGADCFNLFFCKLSMIKNALRMNIATFFFFICTIIFSRSKKEMTGIHTRWIITNVAYIETFWDKAKSYMIGKLMGLEISLTIPEIPISTSIMSTHPFPAFIWRTTLDFRPKTFLGTFIHGIPFKGATPDKSGFSTTINRAGGDMLYKQKLACSVDRGDRIISCF